MSLMVTLARAEAVVAGRATPLATVRHRHLSDRPLVLVPMTAAGEAAAPLGALVGCDRDRPRLLVVPQPRDRDLRFAFLAELAAEVLPYVESYAEDGETGGTGGTGDSENTTDGDDEPPAEPCADAAQLLVPSRAGVEYVRLLGRSMRFRRTAEDDPDTPHPAPPRVPLLGRWLSHYGERARVPGAALLLSATELLARHWATGQSTVEDQHLGALLAWITDGAAAAERAETGRDAEGQLLVPPAGPATDPAFDNRLLAPAMARFDRARAEGDRAATRAAEETVARLVESRLRPTWDAVWRSYDLLRALPEGAHVPGRWLGDRWSFTAHRDRVRAGEPPQPRRDDAVTAARKLAQRERALAELDAQEALDDPLTMAERRLAGQAFVCRTESVEMAYSEGRRPMPRPLVTVATDDEPHLEDGGKVYRELPGGRTQRALVAGYGDGRVTVQLQDGMGRSRTPAEGSVPEPGDRVVWTLFEHTARRGPALPEPEDTPWTHGSPAARAAEEPDRVTAEDFL
ncbi:hypothetical protein OG946_11670 [Streptomyces sp. NBC_01808]|uniref:hypothetical protein n=1 Tax=Streptomyces sp. NBC_01808 TaxID=2975947 RepID=UPI002DD82CCC|nr:hypothetical protein [Streptomyces sp. NBC_01808]WSA37980.1 hypothetical protein OG946_11670 [Streptomyces sp. NBC_01808]